VSTTDGFGMSDSGEAMVVGPDDVASVHTLLGGGTHRHVVGEAPDLVTYVHAHDDAADGHDHPVEELEALVEPDDEIKGPDPDEWGADHANPPAAEPEPGDPAHPDTKGPDPDVWGGEGDG
jgi:hypothetical protein